MLYSRYHQQMELAADRGVKCLGQDPKALISALEKMENRVKAETQANKKEGEFYFSTSTLASMLFKQHPSLEARKKALGVSDAPLQVPVVAGF